MTPGCAGAPATFRPTFRQAAGRGFYLGAVTSAALSVGFVLAAVTAPGLVPLEVAGWLLGGPAPVGALAGVVLRGRLGTDVDARGIRTVSPFTAAVQPWHRVVDLRAERRGGRTVVSVYLESGAAVQLQAPYSGELFAADPQFELKLSALSHLWRSHRFGGVAT